MDRGSIQDAIDFSAYGKILFKRRWTIATFFIIVFTLVTITTLIQTPIFEASAVVQIEPAPPEVVSFKDVVTLGSQSFWSKKEYYQTQFWILRSEPLAQEVVDELDLTNTDPIFAGNPNAARQLSKMVKVQPLKNSQLVKVKIHHPNPEKAALICNVLVDRYQQQNVDYEVKRKLREKTLNSLKEGSSTNEEKLQDAEKDLLKFMEEEDIVSFEGRQNIVLNHLSTLSDALTKASKERVEAYAVFQKSLTLKKLGKGLQIPGVAENELIQELKEQKVLLEKEYAKLSVKYLEENKKVKSVKKQIELLDAKIAEEVVNIVGSAKATYLLALEKENELDKAVEEAKKELQDLNQKAIPYGVLKRRVDSESAIYSELVKRTKETEIMQKLRASSISVRELAEVPKRHITPKRKTNMMLAMILGLFGGVALAFLLEYLDTRIKSQEDVEKATGLPFLGIIPSFSADQPEVTSELFTHTYPKSSTTESIRAIRTNIMFSVQSGKFHKLLVTSAGPQEGKSTTVINLGIIFAQGGNKVLIVDSDLRRPRLHRAFGVNRGIGLTTLIMGESTADKAILTTDVPNLSIIPSGPIPPNPSELLGSDRMDDVIKNLEGKFDVILFDSPPIVAVTDAVVLSRKVDGVVLVVKSGKTTSEMVTRATRQLKDVSSNILGSVLNDFNIKGEGYRYYYYYRYYRRDDGDSQKQRIKRKRTLSEKTADEKQTGRDFPDSPDSDT